MAGTTVTDARKKVFTFSDTYYDTSIVIYTRSSDKVSDYKQLKGKTVGVKTVPLLKLGLIKTLANMVSQLKLLTLAT